MIKDPINAEKGRGLYRTTGSSDLRIECLYRPTLASSIQAFISNNVSELKAVLSCTHVIVLAFFLQTTSHFSLSPWHAVWHTWESRQWNHTWSFSTRASFWSLTTQTPFQKMFHEGTLTLGPREIRPSVKVDLHELRDRKNCHPYKFCIQQKGSVIKQKKCVYPGSNTQQIDKK